MSYGGCEAANPTSEIDALVALAQQANAQGITIVVVRREMGVQPIAMAYLNNFPAILRPQCKLTGSLPYVTGVGGTEFNEGSGTYWQSANGSDVITSALSYIPEKPGTIALSRTACPPVAVGRVQSLESRLGRQGPGFPRMGLGMCPTSH